MRICLSMRARNASFRHIPFILFAILLFIHPSLASASGCDGAGNCYIRAGASGSGNGVNWTNAYSGFGSGAGQVNPSNMLRGVTYWIAAGSYGSVSFNTPDSGTQAITVEGATTANHGPATDWSNSFAGQALFGESAVLTDYWNLNGQTRGADWQSGYTIKFWNKTDGSGADMQISGNHDLNFDYIEMEGTGEGFPNNTSTSDRCSQENCGVWTDFGIYESVPVSNVYVGHGYYHHTGTGQFQMDDTSNGGTGINNNMTWEYNWISYNHTGQNGQHDEAYSLLSNNVIIRYNVFQDISGSGIIVDASANNPTMSNWYVYGNLFFNDPAYLALGQVYWLNTVDQGILVLGDGGGGDKSEQLTGTFMFANNTMANFDPPGVSCAGTYSTLPIAATTMVYGSANTIIENNLWYKSYCVNGNYNPFCNQVSGTCTEDYNTSYSGGLDAENYNWQTQGTPAPHDINISSTTIPFVNAAGSTIASFEPVSPDPFSSNAGVSLGSPYNVDLFGVTRGSNGTWDRGALQLDGNAATLESISVSPANASIATGATQQMTATGSYSDGSTQNLTSSVTWSSSNTAAVTVTSAGVVRGVASGSASVSATSGSMSGSGSVTVSAAPAATLQSIAVTSSASSLNIGSTAQLTAIGTYSDGSTKNLTSSVTWSSSNSGIAVVSVAGLVNGVTAGSATIKAASASISGSSTITVAAPVAATLRSITVTPSNSILSVGGTQQYTATGNYSDGSTKNLTGSVTWKSSNTLVASIASRGAVSAQRFGRSIISASSGATSGSTYLAVSRLRR